VARAARLALVVAARISATIGLWARLDSNTPASERSASKPQKL
jgi:hypothetical protein